MQQLPMEVFEDFVSPLAEGDASALARTGEPLALVPTKVIPAPPAQFVPATLITSRIDHHQPPQLMSKARFVFRSLAHVSRFFRAYTFRTS